ncbi:hypothetical protein B484DRAFT_404639 [Ochromonadaceae sp. CCMP2298]|nr:hypothetical protein B484DRAFT_404639 [Ochromonadaceae sp. CCMP2298]
MGIYYHKACSLHRIPNHPEHYTRVDSIIQALQTTFPLGSLSFREAGLVTKEQILLFHTTGHLARFMKLADDAAAAYSKRKMVKYLSIDSDTTVMWHTKNAAFRAAGAVISALEDMYLPRSGAGHVDTALCVVRPPGHHAVRPPGHPAERDKSCGFCFFNNVAIGAKYAQAHLGVGRVAVLDWDVHHGNGTEEGFTPHDSLFYGSTHGRDHFPGSGKDPSPFVGEKAKKPIHRRIVNRELTPGKKSRPEFYSKWGEILAEMELFRPDLVIMSAGFDAHKDDPLAECWLQVGRRTQKT